MTKRRVVITGMGTISPYGLGVDKFWKSLCEGKSGIDTIKNINLEKHTVHIAGEIPQDVDFEQFFDLKEIKRTDRYSLLGMIAADMAIEDSKLDIEKEDPYRVGVIVSPAAGGFISIEHSYQQMIDRGPTKCTPHTIPMTICDTCAGKISIKHGFKGINKAVLSACATSAHSIGDAFRSIQWGDADVIAAGGTEAVISDLGVGAFTAARTLCKRNDEPQKASRPYDIDRSGFVMSEGAGVLILEELEHAKKRGAKIYAEVVGYGQTADAYDIVAPDPEGNGAYKAMEIALKDAGLETKDVDYINTHGTSTHLGDIGESLAIERLFGDKEKNTHLKVSSTKSMHGHMLGATGAVESIVCIKSINDGIVPPTINLDNQDPEVANLDYTPNKAVKTQVDVALTNSFGFGGHNASLIYKKYEA